MSERVRLSALDNGSWLLAREAAASRLDAIAARRRSGRYVHGGPPALCLFVGYPRSGHSAVGSILDAHPDAVVAHRFDALAYVERGWSPPMLAHMIVRNSRRYARSGRRLTGYSYAVPGAPHGSFRTLRLVAAQEGRLTTERLGRDLSPLQGYERRFGVRVPLLHVVRNPYDNITTWAIRRMAELDPTIDAYFALARAVAAVAAQRPEPLIEIRHEELLERPEAVVPRLCDALGLARDPAHLRHSTEMLYRSPHRSRTERTWSTAQIERVATEMAAFPFFEGYAWDT